MSVSAIGDNLKRSGSDVADLSDHSVGEVESEGLGSGRVLQCVVASPPQHSGTFCHNPYFPLLDLSAQEPYPVATAPIVPVALKGSSVEPQDNLTNQDTDRNLPLSCICPPLPCPAPIAVPVGEGAAAISLPNGNFLCSLCDVGCADLKSLIDHTNGRAHQRRFRFYKKRSVVLTGPPWPISAADLQAFFIGLELDSAVQLCSETNQYQYVTFRSEWDAAKATAFIGLFLYGFPISVAVAEPNWNCPICDLNFNSQWQFQQHHSSEKHQTRMVYCTQCAIALPNLPDWVKEADLMNLFRPQYPLKNKGTSHFLTRQYNPQSGLVQHDGYVIFASASIAHRAREAIETGQLLLAGAYPISAITVETLPAACLGVDCP